MSKSLSQLLASSREASTPAGKMLSSIQQITAGRTNLVSAEVGRISIAAEGFGESQAADVESAVDLLRNTLTQARANAKIAGLSLAQEEAAVTAGLIGSAPKSFLSRGQIDLGRLAAAAQPGTMIVGHEGIETADRKVSVEAYDEQANRSQTVYSIIYNQQAARQSAFGETFFPTIVVAPDQVGYNVSLRLIYTQNEVQRAASGALNDFGRQNVIRAIIDATVLATDRTRLYPVYRNGGANDSTANFAAGISPVTLKVDNADLTTAPLAIGAQFSLLGVSQTDAMLAAGLEDQTDAIDSSVRLANIYLKIDKGATTEYFRIETLNLPQADFNAAPQGNSRLLQLNFATKDLLVSSDLKTVAGAASAILTDLGTASARLKVNLTGSIVQDTADTSVFATGVSLAAVNDGTTGAALSTASGLGATVATTLANVTVVGYDLRAYRTNSNRRNRGKQLDIQHVNYLYTVPLLPPMSALRPVTETEANDGQLLSNLVTAVRIKTGNDAVTALLESAAVLKAFAGKADVQVNQPKLFGISSMLVTPTYIEDSIDVATALDSLTDSDRAADLQALLMNKLRDISTRGYVNSGYGPAADAVHEGQPPKTVVLIVTDPVLYRYLTLTGDTRLVGDQFDYKIVESYDSRLAGQIYFSFGHEQALNSGVPDPLHFGNMAWRPELTVMLPMVRGGAQSMELTVQPSYRHVVNLPVLFKLSVVGISSVIGGKVSLNVSNTVVP